MAKKGIRLGIVGAGANQMPLILVARDAGLSIWTIDGSRNRIGHTYSLRPPIIVDLRDLDAVVRICRARGLSALASWGSDLGMQVTTEVSKRLNITSPSYGLIVSKSVQARMLFQNGVLTPQTLLISEERSVKKALNIAAGWPCKEIVVKPNRRWGSIGVSMHQNTPDGVRGVIKDVYRARKLDSAGEAVLQERLEGIEYGVAVTIESNKVIEVGLSRKMKVTSWRPSGHFPVGLWTRGVIEYDDVGFGAWEALLDAIRTIISFANGGLVHASADLDIVMVQDRLWVLEYAIRGGGAGIGLAIDWTYGSALVSSGLDFLGAVRPHALHFKHRVAEDCRVVTWAAGQRTVGLALAKGIHCACIKRVFLTKAGSNLREMARGSVNNCIVVLEVDRRLPVEELENFVREAIS